MVVGSRSESSTSSAVGRWLGDGATSQRMTWHTWRMVACAVSTLKALYDGERVIWWGWAGKPNPQHECGPQRCLFIYRRALKKTASFQVAQTRKGACGLGCEHARREETVRKNERLRTCGRLARVCASTMFGGSRCSRRRCSMAAIRSMPVSKGHHISKRMMPTWGRVVGGGGGGGGFF
jgi:hypothetical protein